MHPGPAKGQERCRPRPRRGSAAGRGAAMTGNETETRWHDRSEWPPGPWDNEPEDTVECRVAGFPCLLVRGPSGAWCGYVGVPPGHSLHGKSYGDDAVDALNVHGGITYGGACQVGGHICHVPAPGEPDDVWWLGFDCNHSGDVSPNDE